MQTLSEDDRRCMECEYHFFRGELVTCEYLVKTGERRGCKPGLGCKRFQQSRRAVKKPENIHQINGRKGGRPKNPDMVEADREKLEELRGKAGSLNRASKALGFQEMRLNVAYYSGWVNIQVAEAVAREYGIDIRLPSGKQQTEKVQHKAKIKKIPDNFEQAVQAVATQGLTWKEGAAMCGLNPQAFRGLARHKLGIQDVRRRRNIEKLDEQGNVIATYDSVYEAAEQEGYTGAYICRLCREGKRYRYKGASSTAASGGPPSPKGEG
jgi:hypothetical protein